MSNKNQLLKLQNTGITHKEVCLNFFMPVGKLSGNSTTQKNFVANKNVRIIETSYGKLEIRNRLLHEKHQRLINAIVHNGIVEFLPDGRVACAFEMKTILEFLGMGKKNHRQLKEMMKDISDANYYVTIKDGEKSTNRKVTIFQEHITTNDPVLGSRQGVIFSPAYVNMHLNDFSVNFKKVFNKMSNIPYATIPSIIKNLIFKNRTTEEKIYKLEDILKDISFPIDSPSSFKEIKSNLKQYKVELKEDYNITYDDSNKTFKYSRMEGIEFNSSNIELLHKYIGKELLYRNNKYLIKNIIQDEDSETNWTIETDTKKIKLNYYLDDLVFLLNENITKEGKMLNSSLFNI